MNYTKRLFSNLRDFKTLIASTVVFNILTVIFTLASTYIMIPVLGLIFGESEKVYQKPSYYIDGKSVFDAQGINGIKDYLSHYFDYYLTHFMDNYGIYKVLIAVCIIGFLLFIFKNVSRYFGGLSLSYINIGLEQKLRAEIYERIMRQSLSFFTGQRKGDILSRITGDMNEIQWAVFSTLGRAIQDPLTIVGVLISLLILSPQLTLFILILLPLSAFAISRIGKSLKTPSEKARAYFGDLLSIVEESLTGMKVIKSYNATNASRRRFTKTNLQYSEQLAKIARRRELASPLSEMIGSCVIIAIIAYAGILILDETGLSASVFITYIALFYQILQPAKNISLAIADIKRGEAAAKRVYEIIDAPVLVRDKTDALEKKTFDQKIEFKNVSFRYDDAPEEERWAVKDFNLTIPKGKMVALVGPSGSGKSTITNLMCRFFDIKEGSITIDGVDLRDIKSSDVRSLSSLVTQESILFHDTIRNNIHLGNPRASEEDILRSVEIANAKEFIDKLPEGIDTNIKDGGNRLSGGQRQRICIARAVVKDAPILLLDEATSALDTESEKLVQLALENLMKGQTSIVVAHRLSTIQKADIIVVMHDGSIAEQGTHHELVEQNGLYARLIQMQSFK